MSLFGGEVEVVYLVFTCMYFKCSSKKRQMTTKGLTTQSWWPNAVLCDPPPLPGDHGARCAWDSPGFRSEHPRSRKPLGHRIAWSVTPVLSSCPVSVAVIRRWPTSLCVSVSMSISPPLPTHPSPSICPPFYFHLSLELPCSCLSLGLHLHVFFCLVSHSAAPGSLTCLSPPPMVPSYLHHAHLPL